MLPVAATAGSPYGSDVHFQKTLTRHQAYMLSSISRAVIDPLRSLSGSVTWSNWSRDVRNRRESISCWKHLSGRTSVVNSPGHTLDWRMSWPALQRLNSQHLWFNINDLNLQKHLPHLKCHRLLPDWMKIQEKNKKKQRPLTPFRNNTKTQP